jgi:hypothetical protein
MYQTYWRDDIVKNPELYKPGTSYWLYGGSTHTKDMVQKYNDLELKKYGVPLSFERGRKQHHLVGVIYFKDEGYPLDINLQYLSKVLSSDSYQLTEPHEYFDRLTNWLSKDVWLTGEQWILLQVVNHLDYATINFQALRFRSRE